MTTMLVAVAYPMGSDDPPMSQSMHDWVVLHIDIAYLGAPAVHGSLSILRSGLTSYSKRQIPVAP